MTSPAAQDPTGSTPAAPQPAATAIQRATSAAALRLDCECADVVNFAMEQNGVALVRELVVRNDGPAPVSGAAVEVEAGPGLSAPLRLPLPTLAPGEAHRLSPVDVRLEPGRLRAVTEAERGELRCRVVLGDATVAERRAEVRVLAFNEWPGQAAPAGLLASFVLPNHPVVTALLQSVREHLRGTGHSDALDGYQGASRERVREQVEALYGAVQSIGIGYVGAPPSFEVGGQKIRLPDAVLGDRLGCCLDLSVLLAAALEQMGIAPVLVLVRGHAFVAAWLADDRFPSGVVEDAARLRTQVQLGNVLPVEATAVTQAQPVPFEAAVEAAYQRLQDDDAFECAVDVRALRTEYRPLPIRTVAAAQAAEEPVQQAGAGVAARLLARAAAEAARPELVAPPSPPADVELRFRRWKEKLLDLTLRNRLLNFRPDAKGALQLAVPDLALLEDGLHASRSFELLPRPESGPRDPRDPALAARRTQDVADAARLDDLRRHVLHARHGADELWARARHLDREARTALEEGGAAVLHLAIGFLRWYETGASQEARLAPLLLYPVELAFDTRGRRARVRRLADDPVLNVTLVEKLRRDHAVDVSALEALPLSDSADDPGVAVGELLRRFREAIQHIPRWEVLEEAHLGLFQFTKFLMWKDLEDNAERFLRNPVVLRIASRDPVALQQRPSVQPEQVDNLHPSELPTVLNADSSQLAAVASALDGQSFVLQGPPGTGKSQTIANVVAAALARHRTVLFVSEKMAALEVVHRRLRDVGLGDFCLELHSHKANKKEVVASLRAALEHAPRAAPGGWKEHGDALLEARRQLDAYVTALHRPGALGPSVYEARDRLLELAATPDERISPATVAALDAEKLAGLRRQAEELAAVAAPVEPVSEHPFREARRSEWSAAVEQELREALAGARRDLRAWEEARGRLAASFGVAGLASAGAEDAARAAAALVLDTVPERAATSEWPELSARARRCVADRRTAAASRAELGTRWLPSFLELAPDALVRRFERWGTAFFVLAFLMLWTMRRQLRRHARGALPRNPDVLRDLRALSALASDRARLDAEASWTGALLGLAPDASTERCEAALAALDAASPALRRLEAAGGDGARLATALRIPMPPDRRAALLATATAASTAARALRSAEERLGALLLLPDGALPSWDRPEHPTALLALVSRWEEGLRRFRGWCLYRGAAEAFARAGAPELAEAHLAGRVLASQLPAALEKAVLRQWHASAVDADPVLRDFDGGKHSTRVARFRELDRGHLDASRAHVLAALEERLPSLAATDLATSEPALLMREAQKKTRHLPIRRLLREIPGILPRLKPCFLMSPLSVAQYLPAEGKPFDLVVFDEASQICTQDAIGAIARGNQVIIVGDSRQMPPTRFFARSDAEDEVPEDDDVVELESVLDEAVAKLVPQQWLGWHYRSRHESLIEFSNRHIYEGRLDVFPAAEFPSAELGLAWRRVDGIYQGGNGPGGRTNHVEAEALVAHLVERLRRFEPGERTFGVVTFNVPQQQLVLDLLDEARVDPEVDRHFTGAEPVFVKNLENVQGDERDEILFSVCYAPDASHRFRMHYGPLSAAGGERRLNVAVTRARQKLTVFSSIDPEQIDRSRTSARGAWLLREFLQHARDRGQAGARPAPVERPRAVQVQAMAEVLRREGLQVDVGVGCSDYTLDLAVRHPTVAGRYGIAIEGDGPAYRSARSTSDRDRLRGEVLRAMGWNLERVWSSAWWFDPDASPALARSVRAALASERAEPREAPAQVRPSAAAPDEAASVRPASNDPVPAVAAPVHAAAEAAAAPVEEPGSTRRPTHTDVAPAACGVPAVAARLQAAARAITRYESAALAPAGDASRFYSRSAADRIREQLLEVVRREGPIHEELLTRRVMSAWGIERLTVNPTRRLAEQLDPLVRAGLVRRHGEFYWPPGVEPAGYRAYRPAGEDAAILRELHLIAPEELANAAFGVLRDAGSMDRAALGREVARVFGVGRVGGKVRESVDRGIDVLVASGRCEVRGERVQLV